MATARTVNLRAAAVAPASIARRRVVAVAARKTFAKSPSSSTATATYVCIDCGWVYDGKQGPFEKLPASYPCPVCNSPKRRFSKTENKKGPKGAAMRKGAGDGEIDAGDKSFFALAAVGGAVLLAGLYLALSSQVS